jgi:transposase
MCGRGTKPESSGCVPWDEAWELKRRAVERAGPGRPPSPPARLGVDETAVARGHTYLTLVCDLERGTVEYLGEERKQARAWMRTSPR